MSNVTLGARVLDARLAALDAECTHIYVCSQEPTTYAEVATTYALGNKSLGAGNVFGASAAATTVGRQVASVSITGGSISAAGTPSHWAAVDSVNSRLLATGPLSGGVSVTGGGEFTLDPTTIVQPFGI